MYSRLCHGGAAAAFLILLAAPIASGSGTSATRSQASGPNSASAQYGHQVKICHNGKTLKVNSKSADAFVAQGDTLGTCKTVVAPAETTTTTGAPANPVFVSHVAPKTTG
jgi:hypothetical protein